MYSWSDQATKKETELGRELSPEEFSTIQETILDRAIPESLNGDDEDRDPDLRSLVFQTVHAHPDWSREQVKDAVRRQMLDVMTG